MPANEKGRAPASTPQVENKSTKFSSPAYKVNGGVLQAQPLRAVPLGLAPDPLTRGRLATRPRPRLDAKGRRSARCVIVEDCGWTFQAVARGPAAVDLLKLSNGDAVTVVVRAHNRIGAQWWINIAGVLHGQPPETPWYGIFCGDAADPWPFWVGRFDAPDAQLLIISRKANHEAAKRLCLDLQARCLEYQIVIVDFSPVATGRRYE
jgi:hypothetical protein